MSAHKNYTVGQMSDDSFAIYYQSAPIQNPDGSQNLSLRFPALMATDWLENEESSLQDICNALNNYLPIREALKDLMHSDIGHVGPFAGQRSLAAREALKNAVNR
jgi:hypothetical protein